MKTETGTDNDLRRTTFIVAKMDCLAEERLIRMRLDGFTGIHSLHFDLQARRLEVHHTGDHYAILKALESLHLDTTFLSSEEKDGADQQEEREQERRVLVQVLVINLVFFVLEIIAGFLASSMGLVADSLDMLADSIVYGLALFAVGGAASRKKRTAAVAGYFQLVLAVLGFAEVVRRFLGYGEEPAFHLMIIISLLALMGNALCLDLLQKSRNREAHMEASIIFTSNDVLVNLGVIVAGVLVYLTASKIPDLAVGTAVFILVARGACRILRLSR